MKEWDQKEKNNIIFVLYNVLLHNSELTLHWHEPS